MVTVDNEDQNRPALGQEQRRSEEATRRSKDRARPTTNAKSRRRCELQAHKNVCHTRPLTTSRSPAVEQRPPCTPPQKTPHGHRRIPFALTPSCIAQKTVMTCANPSPASSPSSTPPNAPSSASSTRKRNTSRSTCAPRKRERCGGG